MLRARVQITKLIGHNFLVIARDGMDIKNSIMHYIVAYQ